MNKIVPILTLCLAVLTLILNIMALTVVGIACSVPQVGLVAVPAAIVGLVAAAVITPFAFLFKKDILCRISFYIDLVSLALAIAAVIVGFTAV